MPVLRPDFRNCLLLCVAVCVMAPLTAAAQAQRGLDDDRPAASKAHKEKVRPPRAVSVFEWTPEITVPGADVAPAQPAVPKGAIGSDAPPDLAAARNSAPDTSVAPTQAAVLPTPTPALPGDKQKPAAGRVVPVSVFFGGQYQDGGVYLAEPAPLALGSDSLYEVENAGDPLGFFTVHDSTRARGDWVGFGLWAALPPGMTAAEMYPEKNGSSDVLKGTRDPSLDSRDDDDKPTLRKHKPAPVKGKKKQKQTPEDHVTVPDPGADPDRPRLKNKGEDEVTDLPEIVGYPPNLKQTAAVSDANVMDERSFAHTFTTPAEAGEVQAQMQALAMGLLAAAVPAAAHPAPVAGVPRAIRPRNAHVRAQVPKAALVNVQFAAYDLAYQDEPTYVFTAQTADTPARFVSVIARPDVYGRLQPAWSSITDTARLQITPRYRLIDAVDADGDGRAELLMEARDQDGRRFVLFQVYRGVATQVFQTAVIP